MPTQKSKCIKKQNKSKSHKGKTQKGGKSVISRPSIRYKKGRSQSTHLNCTKCNTDSFIVKTLTMGTKTKALLDLDFFDNRFKVFTCKNCGFVQIYSNEITCSGKSCN
jgi:predicted nucleic-acid-binding Zn-ribbon protein